MELNHSLLFLLLHRLSILRPHPVNVNCITVDLLLILWAIFEYILLPDDKASEHLIVLRPLPRAPDRLCLLLLIL